MIVQLNMATITSPSTFLTLSNKIKTVRQVFQLHAIAITGGLISSHPRPTLPKLLYTFTRLLAAAGGPAPSPPSMAYVSALFNSDDEPSTFCYNTGVRVLTLLSSPADALQLFAEMLRRGPATPPDFLSFPFALKACGLVRDISLSRSLHGLALRFGFLADVFVVNSLIHVYSVAGNVSEALRIFDDCSVKDVVSYNSMIDGLVKSGDVASAHYLFEEMAERDSVTWATVIAGYVQRNMCREAIELFSRMMESRVRPCNITLVSALSACAQLGEMDLGGNVHDYIVQNRLTIDAFLCTGLVDFYAKCGFLQTAVEVFEANPGGRNLYTWNAMIIGFAMHGQGRRLLDYFSRMVASRIKPDGVTLLGVLIGCSHSGLVTEACRIFDEMESVYGVAREPKHYGCLMDLFGRAGLVKEAIDLIRKVPVNEDVFMWGGLLAGCRKYGSVEVAEEAAKKVMDLYPEDGGVYSIMAGVYADAKRWDDVVRTRASMSAGPARRKAGCSVIKIDGVANEFVSSDSLHPKCGDIYLILKAIDRHQIES